MPPLHPRATPEVEVEVEQPPETTMQEPEIQEQELENPETEEHENEEPEGMPQFRNILLGGLKAAFPRWELKCPTPYTPPYTQNTHNNPQPSETQSITTTCP